MKVLLMATSLLNAAASAPAPGPPVVVLATALSAVPETLSSGNAGPFNRHAFELTGFDAADRRTRVLCIYPKLVYRCAETRSADPTTGRQRVVVTIPDLDLGPSVVVRFTNAYGARDHAITLANSPQVVHEIEALPLANGGHESTGSDGKPAPSRGMTSERASTVPAMVNTSLAAPRACDQVYAAWVRASATDPVYTSAFGALSGSVLLTRPVAEGSAVRADNLPEWTLSYPMSANRVQFIAHYEVIYRVGICPERVVSRG